jgi:hypothetical protein
VVNIFTGSIYALGIHLPPRLLAFHPIIMFASVKLFLVLVLVGAG